MIRSDYQVIRALLNGQLATKKRPDRMALIEYGKKIEVLWLRKRLNNKDGKTLLYLAAEEGNAKIVCFLLDSLKEHQNTLKDLVTATDNDRRTVLQRAAESGNFLMFPVNQLLPLYSLD